MADDSARTYDVDLFVIGGGMDLAPPQGFAYSLCLLFLGYAAVVALRLVQRPTDEAPANDKP